MLETSNFEVFYFLLESYPALFTYYVLQVRKSIKPLNIIMKTRYMLTGKEKDKEKLEARRRAFSASAGDVCNADTGSDGAGADESLSAAASEPDLRDSQVSLAIIIKILQ